MKKSESTKRAWKSRPTIEGAGVHLKRAFGPAEVPLLDPFLLLDDFHSEDPRDYIAGFPWHPHRGIETVTYVIRGDIEHGDTIGNKGSIISGDVQWMTAGGGILHQEMPQRYDGMMQGFQLWVNLPGSNKMMGPRYRDVKAKQIPRFSPKDGISVKVVAGKMGDVKGPVSDLVIDVEYFDIEMQPNTAFDYPIRKGYLSFAYVFQGSGYFGSEERTSIESEDLVLLRNGEDVSVLSGKRGLRFLLASGKPIGEPVAWGGPIVMNTEEELALAFEELNRGTFVKGN